MLLNSDFEVLLQSRSTFTTVIYECISAMQEKVQIWKTLAKSFD